MRKIFCISIIFLILVGNAFPQSHFSKIWTGNGLDQMNFNALSATINGEPLQVDDEIAIFDGANCVGFKQVTNPGAVVYIITSKDDPTTSIVDGFRVGNTATIKIWDASRGIEITDVSITNVQGSLTFDSSESFMFRLSATIACTPPSAPIKGNITQPSCNKATGSVVLNGLPSTGNWTITRTPGGITITGTGSSTTIDDLPQGIYSFTLTYDGCTSGASENVVINAQPVHVTPSVSIASNSGTNVCSGTSVTFTATPVNGGTSPSYQWKVNGSNTATGSTYTFVPVNGNTVSCVMTSNAACPTSATATSNTLTMAVSPSVTPSVSIASNGGTSVCSGTSVTFTATPVNGGTSPTYQWKVNGNNVSTGSTYSYVPSNNDAVSCVMTSNATCATTATATSSTLTMAVSPSVTPSVSIASNSGTNVCWGTQVTFTATPVNGGSSPAYQWKVNGSNVATGSSYTFVPVNGNTVSCVMTSNATCATKATATSNTLTMTVSSSVTPSVSIASNLGTTVCSGTPVTFTATPVNGGTSPAYQWKVNGSNVSTGSTYSYVPSNNDAVSCVMTSNATCATMATATSNTLTMAVSSSVTPSVSIASNSSTNVCWGTQVTFTATPVNGGTSPAYQWKVNGSNAGSGGNAYTYTPLNGDVIAVVMTSSATCATTATATSNNLAMVVNPELPVSVSISPSENPVNAGTTVTFTATPTNGGTAPVYQWKVNGNNAGSGGNVYAYTPLNGDVIAVVMTSNAPCVSGNPATSNTVTMQVIQPADKILSYRFVNPRIINESGFDSFEFDVQVKANEINTFLWSGLISLNFDNSTFSTDESQWVITKAGAFNSNNSLGNAKYNAQLSINGVSPSKTVSIGYTADGNAINNPASTADFVEVTTFYQTVFSVRGRILSNTGTAGIDFIESTMNGNQYFKLNQSPWYLAYNNPDNYDSADFRDTYVGRVYSPAPGWTQVVSLNWDAGVNTSIWDGDAAIPGESLSNASALRIHSQASLTIPANGMLTVSGDLELQAPQGLRISSDTTGTGSLITQTASGNGSTIVQRYMTTDAWHIVASPVSGQSISDLLNRNANIATSEDDAVRGMMDFNSTLNVWNDYFTNSTPGNLETGKGFCMRTNENSAVSFTGFLHAGNQQVSGLIAEKWNCIGNPFTSAIGINMDSRSDNQFLVENADNLDPSYGAIYVWDQPDASNGMAKMYSVISNASAPFEVQQGQAYLVKLKSGANSIRYNAQMQIHEPALALKSTKAPNPTIKLKASGNAVQASTIIAFINGMTKGLDPTYDAGLLKGTADIAVYSRMVDDNGIPFAIQALPDNEFSSLVIPIGADCKTGGEITFSSESINLPSECKVILEDRQSKTFTDLSKNIYTTTIAPNSRVSNRFYIHTSHLTTGVDMESQFEKLNAYAIRNVELIVQGKVNDQAIASLYDVLGRLVLTKKLEAAENRNSIKLPMLKTGIYMLYIKDNGKIQGFKVPVNE